MVSLVGSLVVILVGPPFVGIATILVSGGGVVELGVTRGGKSVKGGSALGVFPSRTEIVNSATSLLDTEPIYHAIRSCRC
ncbi:hypothetical protein PR003_g15440 [Phytophthora rubi]|uniref:Uncharacterized protein n=2 Tax=Phytophthora TaxID=4783 RepID=A0A6A4EUS5_9STRA|nr:hypothetical protein PF003_g26947 [Phytophthora fragariae]KAE9043493.1 hypothetical protein PR002_g3319 [Phytophthora rubi]KAE9051476.1 hypothetical protein PR001_g1430 [Phytophthora rubi]KAE9327391.1 hypothetical protein PF008_g16417 [Phytophthora fragariae]KAE9329955.1 hypothetical protein PR003_g15440 [Phytophthora rubi]